MNKQEARTLLAERLNDYRKLPYADLVAKIDDDDCVTVVGQSGTEYQIEVQVFWDAKPDGDIRVFGGIDDGRFLAAFAPLCDSFIVSPVGELVGED
ncbi:MAG: hypothetical protein HQ567_03540 [Candidatus Nealsonbacteria bacterium]|nr:hypothetical protein [Candidatus Nealsonbacteria bacterium]